jgi:transcriptional regulator with XRE-family HTH domain
MKFRDHLNNLRNDPEYAAAEEELRAILDIANDVLRLRLEKGWSQADLAEHVGTKQANISRLENGLSNPSVEFLQKIAKALDTELVVHLGAKEPADHTKLIFVHEIPATVQGYPTVDLSLHEYNVYRSSLISYVPNASAERVSL